MQDHAHCVKKRVSQKISPVWSRARQNHLRFSFAYVSGNFPMSSSIFGISSGIRKGFGITSSWCKCQYYFGTNLITQHTMPAFMAVSICSLLALAVTAMTGTWRMNFPSFSSSLIFLVHVNPSMTGCMKRQHCYHSRTIRLTIS